jgi:hypothetical protein
MDELINQVSQRTGLSADKARTAVETVLTYVKGKLPAGVGSQLDQLVSGGGGDGLGDVAKSVGGLFGKK